MGRFKRVISYFSFAEKTLWFSSVILIILSFFALDRSNYLALLASLIGVTSLILNAKGNPVGQGLMVIFSLIYGYISFSFSYYGEMITYLGMTAPMAVFALISWLKNPFKGNRAEVSVNRLSSVDIALAAVAAAVITIVFYFVLDVFNTANLAVSTLSVSTSFLAAYLTFRRSEYFALAYAANDIVLIALWIMACIIDISCLSVVICFCVFLINDVYGFVNWRRIKKRQKVFEKL